MEFEEVWRKVVQINPSLKPGAKVEITEENLRKIVHFAHRSCPGIAPSFVSLSCTAKMRWIVY